jgi:hypothetical protein
MFVVCCTTYKAVVPAAAVLLRLLPVCDTVTRSNPVHTFTY